MDLPFVSVIIPCRNEGERIGRCLDSLLGQDYPQDRIEVHIVDGMSEDGTRERIERYALQYKFLRLIDNPGKIVPTGLNIGIKKARGEIIIRMDAHNYYASNYISKCVESMQSYNVENVGGIWHILPAKETIFARSIAMALSHPFGAGNAYYRIGSQEPKFVDTVPFGCYKREVFDRIGLFDEDLIRNQDDEFNLRLIRNGGKILLVPEIVSYYYARDSLSKLWKMYWQYGYFKPLVARKVGAVMTWRQLVPALFVLGLVSAGIFSVLAPSYFWLFLLVFSSYSIVNIGVSFAIALKKGLKYMPPLPIVFFTIHFSYGIGYLKGILDFILLKKDKREKIVDLPLTR